MDKQGKKKKFHKLLFVKTCFWFSVIMLLFAVVLGVIYMRLYEKTIMNNYREQTRAKAENVAKRCNGYFLAGDPVGWNEYLIMLSEIEQTEVWAISNDEAMWPLPETYSISRDYFATLETYQRPGDDSIPNGKRPLFQVGY